MFAAVLLACSGAVEGTDGTSGSEPADLVPDVALPVAGAGSLGNGTPLAPGGAAGTSAPGVDAGTNGGTTDAGTIDASAVPVPTDIELRSVTGKESAGLDWDVVEGATAYRIYVSDAPGVVPGAPGVTAIETSDPVAVLRGLTDGVARYYVVTALLPGGESTPSNEVAITPGGEWVLEELGSGLFEDIVTGALVSRVPLDRRVQVLLFAEGYTAADLGVLHDLATHAGDRSNDVDRWVDQVFAVEPYSLFPDAFAVWYLPRISNEAIGGDTAFAVPIDASGSFPGVGSITADGETATRAWSAIAAHPYPPVQFYSGFGSRALNHVAYFLMFDPARGRASVSGRASSLTDPVGGNRISAAFGIPFAHEFTHSFSQLSDEYVEYDRAVSGSSSETSNVVASNLCADLPWQHLLVGGAINPDTDELVGAFGLEGYGYHPELVCLLNGTHDNVDVFGGSGELRTDDRMCNFCREVTSFRVFERTGVIAASGAFDTWKASYRAPFYDRHGFVVPPIVPQTNDVDVPAAGMPIFQACVP